VAKTEWAAIQGSRRLKVSWSDGQGLPDLSNLYETWRKQPIAKVDVPQNVGNVKTALAGAARTLKATYDFAIHTHGSMGPACAVAQMKDGKLDIWSPSQATHSLQSEIASLTGVKKENIRLRYLDGSGCYGRNGHEDCTAEAALITTLIGQPVRLQWMREEEHAWDPKSPPTVVDLTAGLDAKGDVVAWDADFYIANQVGTLDDFPLLAAIATGVERKGSYVGNLFQNSPIPYNVPNALVEAHRVSNPTLRASHLRTPGRMQNTFANEAFTDEIAAAVGEDPLRFRLRRLPDARAQAVLANVARISGWQSRTSPDANAAKGNIAKGRGVAYVRYDSDRTYVALVAEVEVNKATGKVRCTKFYVSHDCGQVINPDGTRNQIEGGVVQTVSRTLMEEVKFDRSRVTSTDWKSYPIIQFPEVPDIVIDLIDRPNERAWGAGEMAPSVVPAAVSNAVFDAIGVRLRSVPFTPEKVKAAMKDQLKAKTV
jgi:CO/xanthine dehydrogenase Mo-binding subunit